MLEQPQPDPTPEKTNPNAILYYTSFYLFTPSQAELLYNYKYFIENMIMKLGEDWRIQSNLLSQEIVAIREADLKDHSNFSLFNQFLSAYLRDKIGMEHEHTNFSEAEIQNKFLQTVNLQFHEQKIHNGLTFKTLSLGYCITATEVWNKTFRNPMQNNFKNLITLKPFAILSEKFQIMKENQSSLEASSVRRKFENIDIVSSRLSSSEFGREGQGSWLEQGLGLPKVQWQGLGSGQGLDQREQRQVRSTLQKMGHSLKKTQVLSYFVSYIDQLHLRCGRRVRVFSISNEFYLNAFIIWLIFNIKMFFSLTFEDYLRYFKELISENWKEQYTRPLKKFQLILEREWSKLLKDFTVALHDDQEVLNILVDRVKKCIQSEWDQKITALKDTFSRY